MDKEYQLQHKKLSPIIGILLILAVLIGLIVLTFIFYVLQRLIGIGGLFYVEFVALIIFAVWFSRTRLIEFTYYLSGDTLRIDRVHSSKPKLDLFIRMDNVIFMGKLKNMPEKYQAHKKQRETFKRTNGDCFVIVHLVENKYFTAVLSPSESFELAVMDAWKVSTQKPKKKK